VGTGGGNKRKKLFTKKVTKLFFGAGSTLKKDQGDLEEKNEKMILATRSRKVLNSRPGKRVNLA